MHTHTYITGTIKNWRIVGYPSRSFVVEGLVYGHAHQPDGGHITTSAVRATTKDGRGLITHSGSFYVLEGDPNPHGPVDGQTVEEYLQAARARL